MKFKALSLFANVGIGETYLKDIGIESTVANELLSERVAIYKHLHPKTDMIGGDITDEKVFGNIIKSALSNKVNIIIATPPCQGMSIAGKMKEDDPRNTLIVKVMEAFNIIKPDYMLIENVPQMLKTSIIYNNQIINIKDFMLSQIDDSYTCNFDVFDSADYGTPQYRKRTIIRIHKKSLKWITPEKQKHITVREAIGNLPTLESGQSSEIKWHYAKKHNNKHIHWMKNTSTGKTALENEVHYPQKDNRKIKGFATTYKRIEWDKPAPTVTMANGSISSQNNVHPGRKLKDGTYSDARVLTILEILRVTGLPDNWNPPEHISENTLRHVIGEAVPPLMMKAVFKGII